MNARRRYTWRKPVWRRFEVICGALALAFAGGIASILSPTSRMWWIGQLALIPLVLLVVTRAERFGERSKGVDGGCDDGPWWSP